MLDRWTNTVADIDLYATRYIAEVLLDSLLDALPDAVVTWQQQAAQHCAARFTFADEEGGDHVAASNRSLRLPNVTPPRLSSRSTASMRSAGHRHEPRNESPSRPGRS